MSGQYIGGPYGASAGSHVHFNQRSESFHEAYRVGGANHDASQYQNAGPSHYSGGGTYATGAGGATEGLLGRAEQQQFGDTRGDGRASAGKLSSQLGQMDLGGGGRHSGKQQRLQGYSGRRDGDSQEERDEEEEEEEDEARNGDEEEDVAEEEEQGDEEDEEDEEEGGDEEENDDDDDDDDDDGEQVEEEDVEEEEEGEEEDEEEEGAGEGSDDTEESEDSSEDEDSD